MPQEHDLRVFTAQYERHEMSTEEYRAALIKLCETADLKTRAHIKKRLETLKN